MKLERHETNKTYFGLLMNIHYKKLNIIRVCTTQNSETMQKEAEIQKQPFVDVPTK